MKKKILSELFGKHARVILVLLAFILILSDTAVVGAKNTLFFKGETLKLNPNCKLKRLPSGKVIIYKKIENAEIEEHQFEDIYAEVLLSAYRKQKIDFAIKLIARKFKMSEEDCRREVKHVIHILQEWEILLAEENLLE